MKLHPEIFVSEIEAACLEMYGNMNFWGFKKDRLTCVTY